MDGGLILMPFFVIVVFQKMKADENLTIANKKIKELESEIKLLKLATCSPSPKNAEN